MRAGGSQGTLTGEKAPWIYLHFTLGNKREITVVIKIEVMNSKLQNDHILVKTILIRKVQNDLSKFVSF